MSGMKELGESLLSLANKIVEKVSADRVVDHDGPEDETGARPVKLSEQLDGFKAVSAYYIAHLKVSKKKGADDAGESGFSFAKSREKLRAIEGGKE